MAWSQPWWPYIDAGIVLYILALGLLSDNSESDVDGVGRKLDPIEFGVVIDMVDAFVVE